jgi:hypothetical protein
VQVAAQALPCTALLFGDPERESPRCATTTGHARSQRRVTAAGLAARCAQRLGEPTRGCRLVGLHDPCAAVDVGEPREPPQIPSGGALAEDASLGVDELRRIVGVMEYRELEVLLMVRDTLGHRRW